MKTRSNMPLFVLEVSDVKTLSNSQIDLLRCGDWLVKKDASGEHPYQVTFKKEGVGMCLTYHDASVIETQSYDWNNSLKKWVYNSEDKTPNLLDEVATIDDIESGDVDLPFESIKDKDGHQRFFDGNGSNVPDIFGGTYCKFSLSGSHLLMVLGTTLKPDEGISAYQELCRFNLPEWIMDKIVPLTGTFIEYKDEVMIDGSYNLTQFGCSLNKKTGYLSIDLDGNAVASAVNYRTFRIAFDLLIDNE